MHDSNNLCHQVDYNPHVGESQQFQSSVVFFIVERKCPHHNPLEVLHAVAES